jgi:hypothetical protein
MSDSPVGLSGGEMEILKNNVTDLQIALDDVVAEHAQVSRQLIRLMVQLDVAERRLDAAFAEQRP